MGDWLKVRREQSQKRKRLIARQLGIGSPDNLARELGRSKNSTRDLMSRSHVNFGASDVYHCVVRTVDEEQSQPAKEMVYTDSSTFLKGTQSANPHNDYCQHFLDTGQRPQNFIRDVALAERFEEYPKLKELIRLKDDLIAETACAPMYLKTDLMKFNLRDLGTSFDVVLIEPPLEEYQRSRGVSNMNFWTWDQDFWEADLRVQAICFKDVVLETGFPLQARNYVKNGFYMLLIDNFEEKKHIKDN